ncbi:MAG: PQQ-dependent sugar dehydrogenase [Acidimicrobiales bacterium]
MTSRTGRPLVLALAACVGVAGIAVGGALALGGPTTRTTSSRTASDAACPPVEPSPRLLPLDGGPFHADPVARADEPTTLALLPDGGGDGVLGERPGRLRLVEDGAVTDEVVLDLSDDTVDDGDGGLLAATYEPDGSWLYVYRATKARDDVITAYPVDGHGMPVPAEGRTILHVDHPPSPQHHGGSMLFGPDNLLYVGLGDGGGLGDPRENAQDPATLLGKVLRIDPTPNEAQPYAVPADNPFVDRYGWRPETWVLGVRNPFRMSLDQATGDLWLGDVGQTCWEELDRLPPSAAGGNLGWDRREGAMDFEGGDVPGRELSPVHVYPHADGWCALVAGYVPRSSGVPALDGWLLHTDYCAGRILALRAGQDDGKAAEVRDLGLHVDAPVAIVPGPSGHPWVLTLDGEVLELRSADGT